MKKTLFFLAAFTILATGTAMPASAQHCDVQRGDSMWRIAKRYKVPFAKVLILNKHFKNQHLIHPKDEVELPDGSTGQSTSESGTGDSDAQKTEPTQAETTQAAEILNLVNQERAKAGVPALTLSEKLTSIAYTKAKDMADKNYFSHQSPTYGSPFDMLKQFGVSYSYAGENIAAGQKTAAEVMNNWMNSSGHKANILNKNYTQLGVGFYRGGQYGTEWVQLFIKP
ncbi:CAP domain-containing protein [Anaerotignum sp.]